MIGDVQYSLSRSSRLSRVFSARERSQNLPIKDEQVTLDAFGMCRKR
jgi:hypothetical protein